MALQVSCVRSEAVNIECCTGNSASLSFDGLLITDGAAIQKRIYLPYDYYPVATGVYVADHRGNSQFIDLVNFDFANVDAITAFLDACRPKQKISAGAGTCYYDSKESHTGTTYTPGFPVADTNTAQRVLFYLGGVKQMYGDDWTLVNGEIQHNLADGETLEIYQDFESCYKLDSVNTETSYSGGTFTPGFPLTTSYQKVASFSGGTFTPSFTLAQSNIPERIALYVSGVKLVFSVNWTISGNDINLTIPAESERLEIYQDNSEVQDIARQVWVFVSGVKLMHGVNWTIDGANIVFTIPAKSETVEIFRYNEV